MMFSRVAESQWSIVKIDASKDSRDCDRRWARNWSCNCLRFAAEGAAVLVGAHALRRSWNPWPRKSRRLAARRHGSGGGRRQAKTDCGRVVRAAKSKLGAVDILVNNAGEYGPVKPIEEITPEEWDAWSP